MPGQYVSGLNGDPQTRSGAGLPPANPAQSGTAMAQPFSYPNLQPMAPPPTAPTGATNPWDAANVTGYYPNTFDLPTMLTNANLIARHSTGTYAPSDLSYWQSVQSGNPGISPAYLYARMLGYEAGASDVPQYGPFATGGSGWGGYTPGAPAQTGTGPMGSSGLPASVLGSVMPPNPSVWTQPYSASPGALPIPSFDFTPPTEAQAAQYPGYQFAKDQALLAMQNEAAGRGLLNTSGTVFNLGTLANSLASQNYNNIWNQQYQIQKDKFANALLAEQTGQNQYAQNANDTWSRVYQALTA